MDDNTGAADDLASVRRQLAAIRVQLTSLSARLEDIDHVAASNVEVARDALADALNRTRGTLEAVFDRHVERLAGLATRPENKHASKS